MRLDLNELLIVEAMSVWKFVTPFSPFLYLFEIFFNGRFKNSFIIMP